MGQRAGMLPEAWDASPYSLAVRTGVGEALRKLLLPEQAFSGVSTSNVRLGQCSGMTPERRPV